MMTTRNSIAPVTLAMILAAPALAAEEPRSGEVVPVEARYVFAPLGFDDNDETVVVVDGYLPSGCYRLTSPKIAIDPVSRKVSITPLARFFDVPCIEALVPYHQEVRLGTLPEGKYAIDVKNGQLTESLVVNEASNAGPDDFVYAPVDEATVETNPRTGKLTAVLKGRFTNTCMRWKEARVTDSGKSINVLPIIEMGDGSTGSCLAREIAFRKSVDLPATIGAGRHLLHVRSLNGQSLNHLFFKAPW